MKHEEKDYECPILSKTCPFNNKQFIQKIELGQQMPKEFMDEIMETVVSDLNKPKSNNPLSIPIHLRMNYYLTKNNFANALFFSNITDKI